MTIRLKHGNAVPIVISEKEVEREPRILRKTKFLGYKKGLMNLITTAKTKLAELLHESFFEEEYEVVDPGVISETHYAIQIGSGPSLAIDEVPYLPHCAHHYEIIKVISPEEKATEEEQKEQCVRDPDSPYTGYRGSRPNPRPLS